MVTRAGTIASPFSAAVLSDVVGTGLHIPVACRLCGSTCPGFSGSGTGGRYGACSRLCGDTSATWTLLAGLNGSASWW